MSRKFVHTNLDDCLIAGQVGKSHLRYQDLVFDRLLKYRIAMNMRKCRIGTNSLNILGHTIDPQATRLLKAT